MTDIELTKGLLTETIKIYNGELIQEISISDPFSCMKCMFFMGIDRKCNNKGFRCKMNNVWRNINDK
jgi:hypothetical protein